MFCKFKKGVPKQCLEFQDRGQFTCVARDGFGNYSRSLDLEVKVSID